MLQKPRMEFLNFFRMLNRKRILAHRFRKIKSFDLGKPRNAPRPSKVRKAALLVTAPMFGDSLFVAGLIKKLTESGIELAVYTKTASFGLFSHLPFVRSDRLFGIETARGFEDALAFAPDVLADLEYASNRDFELRAALVRRLSCHCLCTAPYLRGLNLYDGYIDLAKCAHESIRMAEIFNAVVPGGKEVRIGPCCHLANDSIAYAHAFASSLGLRGRKLVYFNAVARKGSTTLSEEQASAIIRYLKTQDKDCFFVCNAEAVEESENVRVLPKFGFNGFCAFLSLCDGIITPDTSVVHVASAFDIPILVIYPGNSLDPCKRYLVSQVWAPMSKIHVEFAPDSAGFHVDRFGYPSNREIYVKEAPVKGLLEVVSKFLNLMRQ